MVMVIITVSGLYLWWVENRFRGLNPATQSKTRPERQGPSWSGDPVFLFILAFNQTIPHRIPQWAMRKASYTHKNVLLHLLAIYFNYTNTRWKFKVWSQNQVQANTQTKHTSRKRTSTMEQKHHYLHSYVNSVHKKQKILAQYKTYLQLKKYTNVLAK